MRGSDMTKVSTVYTGYTSTLRSDFTNDEMYY